MPLLAAMIRSPPRANWVLDSIRCVSDHEAFLGFFCEDCRFRIVGQVPDYPFSALYVGKCGVRALLSKSTLRSN